MYDPCAHTSLSPSDVFMMPQRTPRRLPVLRDRHLPLLTPLVALLATAAMCSRWMPTDSVHRSELNAHCRIYCAGAPFNICRDTNGTCWTFPSSSSERRQIVLGHNDYRQKVALGKSKLPSAGDMMYLTHDWNIELAARIMVGNCNDTFYRSCVGASLMRRLAFNTYVRHGGEVSHQNATLDVPQVLGAWFGELGPAPSASLAAAYDPGRADNASAMLLGAAVKVGCAHSANSAGDAFLACAYFPRPRPGRPLYRAGAPCTAPACRRCTPYADGLCDGPPPTAMTVDVPSGAPAAPPPAAALLWALAMWRP